MLHNSTNPDDQLRALPLEHLVGELRKRGLATPNMGSSLLKTIDNETLIKAVKASQKGIYGVDDRQDLFEITDPALKSDADSVVSLFMASNVIDNGDGTSTLKTENFGTKLNLCSSEAFKDQPTGAFCSGFLVTQDIVATAGHCTFMTSNVTDIRFVFGFCMKDMSEAQVIISNSEIYKGSEIIDRQLTGDGPDWALVKLDRKVTNHRVTEIRQTGVIPDNQAVHVIGHPAGLPIKIAGGANVRDNSPRSFFVANLDTYGGNSGSPVFNSQTHQVEGILVRADQTLP
ncbi:MAG: serine protease [Microcystis sp. LE19-338.1B]|jgi:hypothetical protein|nr:serine protease [Microcystis sp. LE19-338.1B]MCZ8352740.1 serine protease [Rhizobium sp.]